MRIMHALLIAILFASIIKSQNNMTKNPDDKINILIRCDDWGMCHSVNMAAKEVLDKGFPVSASVMFACPWYQEAVKILKQYPNVSVGIHLTLNAEWKNYRWGPISGASNVPSLVDSLGYFFPTRAELTKHHPDLKEIEKELRAQIERAIHSGLKIDYIDYHMGAAVETLERRKIVEKLAAEYHLAVSRYFGEKDVEGVYDAAVDKKLDTLLSLTRALKPGGIKLLVFHIGIDDPELGALIDYNEVGPKHMSRHRQAELNALLSPQFQKLIHEPEFKLINYGELAKERGLTSMKRPDDI
jgi:predicted glycoside hydrolase/deacetylase ChbG (UPF0249 family)